MVGASRRTDHLRHAVGTLVSGLLAQKDVTDVYLNPPEQAGLRGELWVVRHGEDPTVCGTMAADEAMRLVTAVAGTLDTTITKDRPFAMRILYVTSGTLAFMQVGWLAMLALLGWMHRDRLAGLRARIIERLTRRTDPTAAPVADAAPPF